MMLRLALTHGVVIEELVEAPGVAFSQQRFR